MRKYLLAFSAILSFATLGCGDNGAPVDVQAATPEQEAAAKQHQDEVAKTEREFQKAKPIGKESVNSVEEQERSRNRNR